MSRILTRLTLLCALVLGACNTPSVPIPPPQLPALQFAAGPSPGMVVMEGSPSSTHAGARFYVYNLTSADGVIATAAADGSFTTSPFAGAVNDLVQIYFDTVDGKRSDFVCVQLQIGFNLFSVSCF